MHLTEIVENKSKALFTHGAAELLRFYQKGTTDSVRKCFKANTSVGIWAMKVQQSISSF